jgi:hypothetical protein
MRNTAPPLRRFNLPQLLAYYLVALTWGGKRVHLYALLKTERLPPDAARRPPFKEGTEGNWR